MSSALLAASSKLVRREGPFAALRALGQVLRARWDLRRASEVGTVRLRGRAHVVNRGHIRIEDRVRLDGTSVRLDLSCAKGAALRIGEGTYINYGANIGATKRVDIGANCMIG